MSKYNYLSHTAPVWWQPLRWCAILSCAAYYRLPFRVRTWGKLPPLHGPTLLIANHQHEMEAPLVVSDATIVTRSWRYPIFTLSSRRMWEPGFFAERIPWLAPLFRTVNLGHFFSVLGMQPVENELRSRPFVSIAYALRAHGELPVREIFNEQAVERLGPRVKCLQDLLRARNFAIGRTYAALNEVRSPYKEAVLGDLRAQIDADLAHAEALMRDGAAFFLAPEGFYTGDGKMQRFRGALAQLAPLAHVWIVPISYDPLMGRRPSMLYRVLEARPGTPLDMQLRAARPVTTSALLATWLHERGATSTHPERNAPFTIEEAIGAVCMQLVALPASLFIDPELRSGPDRCVRAAVTGMLRLGILQSSPGDRYAVTGTHRHPAFPRTADMIDYQFNFHAETLTAAETLAAPDASSTGAPLYQSSG